MATYVASVIAPIDITWDGGTVHLSPGTVVEVVAGGALETQIGTGNLQTVTGDGQNAADTGSTGGVSN